MSGEAPVMGATTMRAFVGIGANLGAARSKVAAAMDDIDRLPLTRVTARSSIYRSAPVDAVGDDFHNAVVAVETGLDPEALLAALQALEARAGRERPYRHAPRTLDLDLLLFGNVQRHTDTLSLPHPRLFERAFVLRPLHEVAPELVSTEQLARVAGQRVERLE